MGSTLVIQPATLRSMPYLISSNERDQLIAHLRQDAVLRPVIDELPFPEERIQMSEIYPALLRSIVGQQVSTAAARSIYKRFLALFDLDSEDLLTSPAPEVLAKAEEEELRSSGLSRAKSVYVREIAKYFVENPSAAGRLKNLPDEEIINELIQIKGIGRWTVEMMLIFTLGRKDLLPLDDLAIYQTMIDLYDLPATDTKRSLKARMTEIAEKWRPYRSIACLYLYAWRHHSKKR